MKKKKNKKGKQLAGVEQKVKKTTSTLGLFVSVLGGVIFGRFVANKIPGFGPVWVQKLAPGGIVSGLSIPALMFAKNPYAKAALMGTGSAGTADIVNRFTAGSENKLLMTINKATTAQQLGNYSATVKQLMGGIEQTTSDVGFDTHLVMN